MQNVHKKTKGGPPKPDPLLELIQDVHHELGEHISRFLRSREVPFSTILIVRHVIKQPGTTISEVARQTGLAKSRVKAVADDLAAGGLLRKEADPADQRVVRLSVDPAAMARLGEFRAAFAGHLQRVVDAIPPEQRGTVTEGLGILKRALADNKAGGSQ